MHQQSWLNASGIILSMSEFLMLIQCVCAVRERKLAREILYPPSMSDILPQVSLHVARIYICYKYRLLILCVGTLLFFIYYRFNNSFHTHRRPGNECRAKLCCKKGYSRVIVLSLMAWWCILYGLTNALEFYWLSTSYIPFHYCNFLSFKFCFCWWKKN